jgi:hypothetical protein
VSNSTDVLHWRIRTSVARTAMAISYQCRAACELGNSDDLDMSVMGRNKQRLDDAHCRARSSRNTTCIEDRNCYP